ncbi:hypothetical protein ACCO45_013570 [Purpureocillium lilacinum]|uniref:Uncharacterized protein n=1 Tax=Purpureocillium lilacinum TaxID=33203 RepID=A0ACC4D701_PURLI
MYTLRTSPDDSSAETWARAILGDVPNLAENLAWHWLLRFPLHHEKSAAHVAGWRIGGKADEWIRIENSSWLMDGNIVVVKKQQEVSLVTMEGALKMQKSA